MYFKSVEEIETYLEKKQFSLGIDLTLDRMDRDCQLLGNPEKQLKVIHYAGSNGKGSTLHYNQEILLSQGYSVASYTSPAQQFVYDQLKLNGMPMTAEVFVSEMNQLIDRLGIDNELTEYELVTLLAFQYFAKANCDFALIEVGMGGRLDATNVVYPLVSVITTISLEHTQFLGDTFAQITAEKAGIIKESVPVVIGKVPADARKVIRSVSAEKHAKCLFLGEAFSASRVESGLFNEQALSERPGPLEKIAATVNRTIKHREIFTFNRNGKSIIDQLAIQMVGSHQIENAAVAVMVCEILKAEHAIEISENAIRSGLANAKWAGRFELLSSKSVILLDGAHNPDGIRVFIQCLSEYYPHYHYKIVFSCLKDKDVTTMIAQLDDIASSLTFTEMKHKRSATATDLFAISNHMQKKIELDYAAIFSEKLADNELLAIVGSLQFIKEIRAYFNQ